MVDDSSLMRLVISNIVKDAEGLELTGVATNGLEAVEMTASHKPDVVLMDLTMADYDGLYAIRRIMAETPTPIVVLSARGNSDPGVVFEAMEAGAYDFLHKPDSLINSQIRSIEEEVVGKLVEATQVDGAKVRGQNIYHNTFPHTFLESSNYDLLAIGASTGGPRTIENLLQMLPSNMSIPIVIAQHMPSSFIAGFAERLNDLVKLHVKVGEEGERLRGGTIYFASGNGNIRLVQGIDRVKITYTQDRFPEFNGPSVDCLFHSAAEVYGDRSIGLILTGMGRDGARGMADIHSSGGMTIAQDEKSSVIFGMPKAAIANQCVDAVLPLSDIAGYIVSSL